MNGYINGIFEGKNGGYYWMDCLDSNEINEAKYFTFENKCAGYHKCEKSAIYEDMEGYLDELQCEKNLCDYELYVVTYFKFDEQCFGLEQKVDFGITKQEIINNVTAQKYVEGATYFTMGHMFYATRMMIEEMEKEKSKFDYYEIEFGILADGAQTGDYESCYRMCIKAKHWPNFKEAEKWLESDMVECFGCDCVHSITKIGEKEAFVDYGMDDCDCPIFG